MKKLSAFVFLLLLGALAQGQVHVQSEIGAFIDSWHQAAADNDQEAYFACIADDGIYIGTDSTEVWTRETFYEWSTPHFEKKKGWSFKALDRNIYLGNDRFAWFDEQLSFGKGTLRGSGVLVKSDNEWQIMHYVLSIPVPNDKFQDVMKVIHSKPIVADEIEE